MKHRFSGQHALILGGSCDLALCLAQRLIQEGLLPVLTWRNESAKQRLSARLHPWDGKYRTAYWQMGNRASLERLFLQLEDRLDYLVDFAQGDLESFIGSADPDAVQRYFGENISFRAETLKKAARVMLKSKSGRMIFISSIAAVRSNAGQGFYAAAKLASEALYRNLGIEMASRGITTMSLRLGYVDAGRGKRFLQARPNEALKHMPIGSVLSDREVAEAIVFFLSDAAAGVNAAQVTMDGGLAAEK